MAALFGQIYTGKIGDAIDAISYTEAGSDIINRINEALKAYSINHGGKYAKVVIQSVSGERADTSPPKEIRDANDIPQYDEITVAIGDFLTGIPVGVNQFATYDPSVLLIHELSHVFLWLTKGDHKEIDVATLNNGKSYENAYTAQSYYFTVSTGLGDIGAGLARVAYQTPIVSDISDATWRDYDREKVNNELPLSVNKNGSWKYYEYHKDDVNGTVINVTVYLGVENDCYIGGKGDEIVYGGKGIDYIVARSGNDILDGGPGSDTLCGGDNDDVLRGGADTDHDVLSGEAGNDIIYAIGYDEAEGGAGNDIIFSSGNLQNNLYGSDGYDYYLLDGSTAYINDDTYQKFGSKGAVFVMINGEYEKLTGGVRVYDASGNWTGTWKGPFGEIYTYKNGSNIEVHIGNSTIYISAVDIYNNGLDMSLPLSGSVTSLVSVAGNGNGAGSNGMVNSLTGGSGNDTFFVDNIGDKITEQVGGGNDTVLSSVTYTLSDNVEMLVLMGNNSKSNLKVAA